MVKLYILVDGELKLVDIGVEAKTYEYECQGYVVKHETPFRYERITQPTRVYHQPKPKRRSLFDRVRDFFTPEPWGVLA